MDANTPLTGQLIMVRCNHYSSLVCDADSFAGSITNLFASAFCDHFYCHSFVSGGARTNVFRCSEFSFDDLPSGDYCLDPKDILSWNQGVIGSPPYLGEDSILFTQDFPDMTGGPDDFLAKDENASISSSMNDSAYMSQAESRRQSRLRHTMNDRSAANGAVFQHALSSPSMSSDNYAVTSEHPSGVGQYVLPHSSLTVSQQDQGTMSSGWTTYSQEVDMSQRQVTQPHSHGYTMPQYLRHEGEGNNPNTWHTTASQPTNGAYSMGTMDPSMFMPYASQGPVYTQPLYIPYPSFVSPETIQGNAMAPPRRLAHEQFSVNTNNTAVSHFDPATSSLTPTTARSARREHGRRTSAFEPNSAFDAASEISHADSFLTEPYSAVASERGHAEVQRISARQPR